MSEMELLSMPISILNYTTIKDKYCICYLGCCNEYVVQLIFLRPYIEEQLPGLQIYICCKSELSHLTNGYERIIYNSEIQDKKKEFAHIRTLKCNMIDHPILELFNESDLVLPRFPSQSSTRKCVIYPRGCIPTQSISVDVVNKIKEHCNLEGYSVQIDGNMTGAGWVVGVENENLYTAGFKGIKTSLIPTGIGTKLYKSLFGSNIIQI